MEIIEDPLLLETGLVRHVYIWMYQVGTCIYDTQFAVVPLYPNIYIYILSKAIGFLLLGNIWNSNMNPVRNSCILLFQMGGVVQFADRLTGLPTFHIESKTRVPSAHFITKNWNDRWISSEHLKKHMYIMCLWCLWWWWWWCWWWRWWRWY